MFRFIILLTLLPGVVILPGCESPGTSGLKKTIAPLFYKAPTAEDEEVHRKAFQEKRDPKDLHWLLAHRIDAGMTAKEVGDVIGEEGERINRDSWVKNAGGHYQSTDEVWRWRAARDGQSIHLVFRDGTLVNYDPSQFREEE